MIRYLVAVLVGFVAVVVFALGLESILKASDIHHRRDALFCGRVLPPDYARDYSSPSIPDMQRLVWLTRHNDVRAKDALLEIYSQNFEATHIVKSFQAKAFAAVVIQLKNSRYMFRRQMGEKCHAGYLDYDFCASLTPKPACMCGGWLPTIRDVIDPLPSIRAAVRSIK